MNSSAKRLKSSWPDLAAPLVVLTIAVAAFLAMVGWQILIPTNVDWLGAGDPQTHLLGWEFFRHSAWGLPLGANPDYGLELSNSILYSDSIPLLAFLFKPFSALLSQPFQYFGLWVFVCFVLQGWFGWKLLGLVTDDARVRVFGAGLFILMPALLVRIGTHNALVAHWLIVAALYLVLAPVQNQKHRCLHWSLLVATTALVHTYLLFMVLALWFADWLNRLLFPSGYRAWRLLEVVFIASTVLLCLWQAGLFMVHSDSFSSGTYRFFRMNLHALFDPARPLEPHSWSFLLPNLPQSRWGEAEGFNFLGLGSLIALTIALSVTLKRPRRLLPPRRLATLSLALLVLFLLAISGTPAIGINEYQLDLPGPLMAVTDMFRASGRLFWPVLYALLFATVSLLVHGAGARATGYILAACLLVQFVDTYPGWSSTQQHIASRSLDWKRQFKSPFWESAAEKYQNIRLFLPGNRHPQWLPLAHFAAAHGMATNAVYLARIDTEKLKQARETARKALASGRYRSDTLYIVDRALLGSALRSFDSTSDLLAKIDGFHVVAPGWKRCSACPVLPTNQEVATLGMNQSASFTKTGTGGAYLLKGWAKPEAWGTWSNGTRAEILLPAPPASAERRELRLTARSLVAANHPMQTVLVHINDSKAASIVFTLEQNRGVFSIPIPLQDNPVDGASWYRIIFDMVSPARPSDLGIGTDKRQLGLGLSALSIGRLQ